MVKREDWGLKSLVYGDAGYGTLDEEVDGEEEEDEDESCVRWTGRG